MKKLLIPGIVAVALIAVAYAGFRLLGGAPYQAVKPKKDLAVQAVYATGTVEATVMLPIAARTTARLMELLADEGSEVKKDQVLARLEDTDLRQSLNELRAREHLAKTNFNRLQSLVNKNAISRGEFDTAKANYDAAKAMVAAAEAQLSYLALKAPEDGRIIRRDGEIGQMIAANQAVFWMSCCAPLRITSEVDEEDIALVQPGQKVLIRADAFPGEIFHGTVQQITPKGDPIARSYRVRINFTEQTPLLIGMTAETNIIIKETENAMVIPTSALQKDRVWVITNGKAARRKVTTGAIGLGSSEIVSGLSFEDIIVLRPDIELEEGMRIRAKLVEWEVE